MKKNGFTLIEVVVVIVILSIIAGIGSRVIQAAFNSYLVNQNITTANTAARLAFERMTRDIHNINSAASISTATSSQLSFTDIYGNTITYQLTGTQLMRSGQVLADGVSSLNFLYWNQSLNTASSTANICYISPTLTFSFNNNVSYSLRTTVSAMNFC